MKKRDIALMFGGALGAAVAVKLLTRARTVRFEDVAERVPHSDRSRFVQVDGMRVHYQEFGEQNAPPIILIHGYTASAYVWKTTAPMLAEAGFRVIALDLIGFGYSDKPRSFEYSIGAQAAVVKRFMDRLGIGSAAIAGSSYGGAVALTIALDYPESVDRLILVDAVINDEAKNHPLLRLAALPVVGEVVTPFFADSRAFLKMRMHNTLARENHQLITADRIENIIRPLRAADGHHSLLATSRAWRAERIEQDLYLVRQPTLIVWGEDDTVIPVRNAYKLHTEIEDSRLVIFKNCGHVPQEERSELFCAFVAGFCK